MTIGNYVDNVVADTDDKTTEYTYDPACGFSTGLRVASYIRKKCHRLGVPMFERLRGDLRWFTLLALRAGNVSLSTMCRIRFRRYRSWSKRLCDVGTDRTATTKTRRVGIPQPEFDVEVNAENTDEPHNIENADGKKL